MMGADRELRLRPAGTWGTCRPLDTNLFAEASFPLAAVTGGTVAPSEAITVRAEHSQDRWGLNHRGCSLWRASHGHAASRSNRSPSSRGRLAHALADVRVGVLLSREAQALALRTRQAATSQAEALSQKVLRPSHELGRMTGRGNMAGCSTSALTIAHAEAGATAVAKLGQRQSPCEPDLRTGGAGPKATNSAARTPPPKHTIISAAPVQPVREKEFRHD
jgi:hypothetical protein